MGKNHGSSESIQEQVKRQWDALATKAEGHTLEIDIGRAEVIAEGVAGGMTQEDIAEILGIKQQHVSRLLVYYRFQVFVREERATEGTDEITPVGVIPITEQRFRQYWLQMARLPGRGGRPPKDPDRAAFKRREIEAARKREEQRIFRAIVSEVQAGRPPVKRYSVVKPEASADRIEASRRYRANIGKEVSRIRETIDYDLKVLRQLSAADHPMRTAPDLVAHHARRIEAGLDELRGFLEKEFTGTKQTRPSEV